MVFYFKIPTGHIVYIGKDKYENEELIKNAWKEDIWFHVDDFSSAHVYLRMFLPDYDLDNIPQDILNYCAQLTRENSIKGSKESQVDIVYTPASNIKKSPDLDIGTVNFYNSKLLRYVKHVAYNKDMFKLINKTKEESYPDLEKLKNEHEQLERIAEKKVKLEKKNAILEIQNEKKKEMLEIQKARNEFNHRDFEGGKQEEEDDDDGFI